MGTRVPRCPKCSSKLLWNGRTMCCVGCSYVEPVASAKSKSEKRLPAARRSK